MVFLNQSMDTREGEPRSVYLLWDEGETHGRSYDIIIVKRIKTMKIALCSDWVHPTVGGVQSHIAGLASQLNELGHEVIIVTKEMNHSERKGDQFSSKIKEIKTRRITSFKHVIVPPNPNDLKTVMKREKFDVVHAHHAFTPTSLLSIRAANEQGIPTVLTNHSISVANSSDTLWNSMSYILSPLKKYINTADCIIAVSHAAAEFIERFVENKDVRVIPNGVDVSRFSAINCPDPGLLDPTTLESPTLLSLGRLAFRKGFHLLIEAMPNILNAEPNTKLYIAGNGYMTTFLRGLTTSLGLNGSVGFLGYVPDDALSWLYNNCDIFIIPSISAESFGITLIEAMAARRPVVASRIGGIPEIIEDGVNGMLFDPWDSRALSEKVVKLLRDPNMAERMGRIAYETVERKYSWPVVARQIEKVYKDIT